MAYRKFVERDRLGPDDRKLVVERDGGLDADGAHVFLRGAPREGQVAQLDRTALKRKESSAWVK